MSYQSHRNMMMPSSNGQNVFANNNKTVTSFKFSWDSQNAKQKQLVMDKESEEWKYEKASGDFLSQYYRVAKAKLENYPLGLETRGFFYCDQEVLLTSNLQ